MTVTFPYQAENETRIYVQADYLGAGESKINQGKPTCGCLWNLPLGDTLFNFARLQRSLKKFISEVCM